MALSNAARASIPATVRTKVLFEKRRRELPERLTPSDLVLPHPTLALVNPQRDRVSAGSTERRVRKSLLVHRMPGFVHGRTHRVREHVIVEPGGHANVVAVGTAAERMRRHIQAPPRRVETDLLGDFEAERHLLITRQRERIEPGIGSPGWTRRSRRSDPGVDRGAGRRRWRRLLPYNPVRSPRPAHPTVRPPSAHPKHSALRRQMSTVFSSHGRKRLKSLFRAGFRPFMLGGTGGFRRLLNQRCGQSDRTIVIVTNGPDIRRRLGIRAKIDLAFADRQRLGEVGRRQPLVREPGQKRDLFRPMPGPLGRHHGLLIPSEQPVDGTENRLLFKEFEQAVIRGPGQQWWSSCRDPNASGRPCPGPGPLWFENTMVRDRAQSVARTRKRKRPPAVKRRAGDMNRWCRASDSATDGRLRILHFVRNVRLEKLDDLRSAGIGPSTSVVKHRPAADIRDRQIRSRIREHLELVERALSGPRS